MLPTLEGFAAASLLRLDRDALERVVTDLEALQSTVVARSDLSAVLSDTSISNVARGQVVNDILSGKVAPESLAIAVYAASHAPAQEVPHTIDELAHVARVFLDSGDLHHASLGLLDARRRVAGFADALLEGVDTESFTGIEDDLFRWARTVEGNESLRRLLLDRDAPFESRIGITNQLLEGKVHDVALALAQFVIVGGRPRDVVGTLDFLVNYVAQARDWRVARVHTARAIDDVAQRELVVALHSLTGKNVELQVAEDPSLLSGLLVEIGDLRLDASTRGRLGSLHDAVASGKYLESTLNRND